MPTNFTDQFFTLDPANPPSAGSNLNVRLITLTDRNNDGDIDRSNNDTADGLDVRSSWPGDTVTINVPGVGDVTYEGTTLYLSDGSAIFTPTDGQVLKGGDFVSSTFVTSQGPLLTSQLGPPCFVEGTRILTQDGEKRVEGLRAGDLVITLDKGPVPLVHVTSRKLTTRHLAANPRHGPIRLPLQAFTGTATDGYVLVSPQHRMLIRSTIAARIFGTREVLAPAAQLVGHEGIERATPDAPVVYYHLIFDHHAIVIANGFETESLYLGANALCELDRTQLLVLQQHLSSKQMFRMQNARPFVSGKKLKQLLMRHAKNQRPLCEPYAVKPVLVA